jgi:nucleoside-diphosphate-sugar epimerase
MKEKLSVFISGARGFIGKNLVEFLRDFHGNKYEIYYPYHNELELLDSDQVAQYLENNNIDVIIHCANLGGTRKTNYDLGKTDIVSKNLRMFFNLARCVEKSERIRQMIHLGSGAEYDREHYIPRMPEDYFDRFVPKDDYGYSKYVCSKYIEHTPKIINLRMFGVFGKYEDYEYRFISNAIIKNLLGMPIVINQNVFFDYMYIDDMVKLIELFIGKKTNDKFYNAVTGKTIDLLTIADTINKISKNPSEIIIKNPGLNTEYSGDNSRLLRSLGSFNFTSIEDSIRKLYQYYKENFENLNKESVIKDEYINYCHKI